MKWNPGVLVLGLGVCLSEAARGFIPSVPNMVKEVLEGRTAAPAFVQLRHRVKRDGELQEIEELIHQERGKIHFTWRSQGKSYSGSRAKDGYAVDPDKKLPSKSSVFLRYFLTTSSENLQQTLVNEGFIRQAQTQGYKPGFTMEGDPATWNVKENFVIQPDIFLVRLPTDTAVVVVGSLTEDSGRMVYFDDDYRGIRRLEWKDGGKTSAWNFQQFSQYKDLGHYPKLMSFEVDGTIQVETSLVTLQATSTKKTPKPMRSTSSVEDNDEELLDVLLSYR